MKNFILKLSTFLLVSAVWLSGCSNADVNNQSSNNTNTSVINTENLNLEDSQLVDDSVDIGSSNTDTVDIFLNGDSIQCDNPNVMVEGSVVTIGSAGVYNVTGTLNDGQIVVNCSKEEKVELLLNGVDITCTTTAPICVLSADKTILNLVDGSNNLINDNRDTKQNDETTSTDTNIPNGAIYSKDDLTIKGKGSLNVYGNYNNGIITKNDLKITGGSINVEASNDAIKGKDSITIKGGTLNLTCNGDGIQTDNTEESEKGYIYIENGTITIDSQGDCIKSDTYTTILDGNFNLTSANGYTNASTHGDFGMGGNGLNHGGKRFDGTMPTDEDFNPKNMQPPTDEDFNPENMQPPTDEDFNPENMQPQSNYDSSITNSDTLDAKTITANGDLTIEGGTFNLNSQDSSIHSNANVTINSGTFTINSGNDGIHADYDCTINGGTIDIQNSYEGIEGANVYINDGNITINSSDDGFNGSDKTNSNTSNNGFGSTTGYVEFNGGYTYVKANGDGIDSNGDMVFNDGIIIVDGPTNGGNGSLDCGDNQNTIKVNGGTLIAGGSQQMFEVADSSSTQNCIYCLSLSADTDSTIVLCDDDNNVICAFKTSQPMESIIFSSSNLETGKVYHIYKDVNYDGTFDNQGYSSNGSFSNGTEVGSVEVTSTINQIGTGSLTNGGFGGRNMKGNRPF